MDEQKPEGFTKEQIEAWESTYEDVAVIKHADGRYAFVMRPPAPAEYKRFRGQSHVEDERPDAQELMVQCCVVGAWFKDRNGVIDMGASSVEEARRVMKRILTRFAGVCDMPGTSKQLKRLFGDAVEADAK